MSRVLEQDIEYVDVRSSFSDHDHHVGPNNFYEKWVDQSSAKHADPELIAADALRRLYPSHSLIISEDYRFTGLLSFPGITVHPAGSAEMESGRVLSVTFTPIPKRVGGKLAGSLVDNVIVGTYKLTWNNTDFIVHIAKFQLQNIIRTVHFILHDGPEQPVRDLVLAVCLYTEQTHDEIWVFNQGFWSKNKSLWLEIKDSSWVNVIMKEENKRALQKDVYGFFKSEMTYKKLSIPWKRGLILYGPPGNGKTITIKVIMKTCTEQGFTPLYVKSFQSFQGEEGAMQAIFSKARQLAPCVLILEDLDSLINDRNRSFFLNQLDGLEGNDGLLVIASTNHFNRLDPGLSNRPSRFDRKYLFGDPDRQERVLYAKYWQEKLNDNDKISFPDSLVEEVAEMTLEFSFAYLKEAFVSTLVRITNDEDGLEFSVVLKSQITALRKELGKQTPTPVVPYPLTPLARLKKMSDESVQFAKEQSTASWQGDKSTERSRRPRQLPLPGDACPIKHDVSEHRFSMLPTPPKGFCSYSGPEHASLSGTGDKDVFGRRFNRGCVLPAPFSAYPQVMPGTLPPTGADSVLKDPVRPVRPGAVASSSRSASDLETSRKNPFSSDNPPMIKIDDESDAEEPVVCRWPRYQPRP
ncbi:P-loop containing nucleoside triphosphate hydrolase protein [Chiua virens]|nr:P-loop containing nucleoside triphosphate hydrolase protein [Chiua virens]